MSDTTATEKNISRTFIGIIIAIVVGLILGSVYYETRQFVSVSRDDYMAKAEERVKANAVVTLDLQDADTDERIKELWDYIHEAPFINGIAYGQRADGLDTDDWDQAHYAVLDDTLGEVAIAYTKTQLPSCFADGATAYLSIWDDNARKAYTMVRFGNTVYGVKRDYDLGDFLKIPRTFNHPEGQYTRNDLPARGLWDQLEPIPSTIATIHLEYSKDGKTYRTVASTLSDLVDIEMGNFALEEGSVSITQFAGNTSLQSVTIPACS